MFQPQSQQVAYEVPQQSQPQQQCYSRPGGMGQPPVNMQRQPQTRQQQVMFNFIHIFKMFYKVCNCGVTSEKIY